MPLAFTQGERFVGKKLEAYTIERMVGQGAWSAVYRASQQGRPVLLTLYFLPGSFSLPARQLFMTRLYKDGAMLLKLQHKHIVPLLDVGEQSGYPYQVTAFVAGTTLSSIVKQKGNLSPEEACFAFTSIATALDYAHKQGVVHGALTSEHILLDAQNIIRVSGFGANRIGTRKGIVEKAIPYNHLHNIIDMPLDGLQYMAPEALKDQITNPLTDVYSAGILLFELLCGRLPARTTDIRQSVYLPPPSSLNTQLPIALDLVILRAIDTDPAQRYQSVGQFARAFEQALAVLKAAKTPVNRQEVLKRFTTLAPSIDWVIEEETQARSSSTPKSSDSSMQSSAYVPHILNQAPTAHTTSTKMHPHDQDATNLLNQKRASSVGPQVYTSFWKQRLSDYQFSRSGLRKILTREERRKTLLVATGGVTILGLGIFGLTRLMQSVMTPTKDTAYRNGRNATATTQQATQEPTATTTATPTPKATALPAHQDITPTTTLTAPVNAQPSPNTRNFINTFDNQPSLLIHLPDGTYVAFESACTHQGATVYYDDAIQQIVCPAHGAHYDPTHRGEAIAGPTIEPLISVPVNVNANGTISILPQ